jgi:hypothetical protein
MNATVAEFIGTARGDDSHLRIRVTVLFLGEQSFGNRVLQRRRVAHALHPPETGFHCAFVLVDGVNAGDQIAH